MGDPIKLYDYDLSIFSMGTSRTLVTSLWLNLVFIYILSYKYIQPSPLTHTYPTGRTGLCRVGDLENFWFPKWMRIMALSLSMDSNLYWLCLSLALPLDSTCCHKHVQVHTLMWKGKYPLLYNLWSLRYIWSPSTVAENASEPLRWNGCLVMLMRRLLNLTQR